MQPENAAAELDFDINSRILETKSRSLISKIKYRGNVSNIFTKQKDFVYQVLANIGISRKDLPRAVVQRIDKMHTTNIKAFVAFSRGIDYRDQGKLDEARLAFKYARTLDPKFRTARRFESRTPKSNETIKKMAKQALHRSRQHVEILLTAPTSFLQTPSNVMQQINVQVPDAKTVLENVPETPDAEAIPENIPQAPNATLDNIANVPNAPGTNKVDIETLISQADSAVDLVVSAQAQPEKTVELLKAAISSDKIDAGSAMEAVLVGMDDAPAGVLEGVVTEAMNNGLSSSEAQDVVSNVVGDTCQ